MLKVTRGSRGGTRCIQMSSNWGTPRRNLRLYTRRRANKEQTKGNYWNDYVRVPWNVYVIGDCCYRVRVEETRKELSYLSAIGAVTTEGNFNKTRFIQNVESFLVIEEFLWCLC